MLNCKSCQTLSDFDKACQDVFFDVVGMFTSPS